MKYLLQLLVEMCACVNLVNNTKQFSIVSIDCDLCFSTRAFELFQVLRLFQNPNSISVFWNLKLLETSWEFDFNEFKWQRNSLKCYLNSFQMFPFKLHEIYIYIAFYGIWQFFFINLILCLKNFCTGLFACSFPILFWYIL